MSVGDFNGDGNDDIAGRTDTNGRWWLAKSTGTSFVNEFWTRGNTTISLNVTVGDYDGDGRDDIAGRTTNNGSWWVARSTPGPVSNDSLGVTFTNEKWGQWSTSVNWSNVTADDFDGALL